MANTTCLNKRYPFRFVWVNSLHQQHLTTMFLARTQRGDTQMGFGLTTSFLMACHTYVIVSIFFNFEISFTFNITCLLIPSYSNCCYSAQILKRSLICFPIFHSPTPPFLVLYNRRKAPPFAEPVHELVWDAPLARRRQRWNQDW